MITLRTANLNYPLANVNLIF